MHMMASCTGTSIRALKRPQVTTIWRTSLAAADIAPKSCNVASRRRSMATEAAAAPDSTADLPDYMKVFRTRAPVPKTKRELMLNPPPVTTTIYKFPTLEPVTFKKYDAQFLHLPLRRDILHRAVVFEGNAHRLGRAKTQWRSEVHGSGRKLRPQKGSGKARLGDRSSPMLRGGAKAHGPKPRDFRTGLPRKVYDLAYRTALSYRYRKGELVIIDKPIHPEHSKTRYMRQILLLNGWGKDNGKTLFITMTRRNNLFCGLNMLGHHGRAITVEDVDVKDLLEMGRIVIERSALEWLGEQHGVDLKRGPKRVDPKKLPNWMKKAAGIQKTGDSLAEEANPETADEALDAILATDSVSETVPENSPSAPRAATGTSPS